LSTPGFFVYEGIEAESSKLKGESNMQRELKAEG